MTERKNACNKLLSFLVGHQQREFRQTILQTMQVVAVHPHRSLIYISIQSTVTWRRATHKHNS
ncbi:hypothetical protein C7Q99_13220, partial [Staphylococcus aureus]